MEWNTPTADQWYLAQIAREIAAIFSKKPITTESKLLKWKFGDGKEEITPEIAQQRMQHSKNAWGMAIGRAFQQAQKAGKIVGEAFGMRGPRQ